MALEPQSAALVEAINSRFPALGTTVLDAAHARSLLAARPAPAAPRPAVARVEDRLVPGPAGAPAVPVRIYWPDIAPGDPSAGIVFFHGGGFVICSIETHDAFCRRMANATGAVVISVEYRLAPEAPFPAAFDDATCVTRWVIEHAAELGISADRLGVAGDSAGGNLALAVALSARDHGWGSLAASLLIYPMVCRDFETPSYRENAVGYAVTRDHLKWYWEQYLGAVDGGGEHESAYATPLFADLSGLPPTQVVAAEHCPLRSENELLAERLTAMGVDTTWYRYDGVAHGFFTLGHLLEVAAKAQSEVFTDFARVLA